MNSAIVYEGPSQIDGSPIVGIVTGLGASSSNAKTGAMAQLYILRADLSPCRTLALGLDCSICGDCPHRSVASGGSGGCYVVVPQGPTSVYGAYVRGSYRSATGREVSDIMRVRGLSLRYGAYGDPAALPLDVLRDLGVGIRTTGYTHAWRTRPDLRPYVMASVDTPAEFAQAKSAGWRTFRVRLESETLNSREIACPASAEAGKRTVCADCLLCSGKDRDIADVAIIAHGSSAAKYIAMRAV